MAGRVIERLFAMGWDDWNASQMAQPRAYAAGNRCRGHYSHTPGALMDITVLTSTRHRRVAR